MASIQGIYIALFGRPADPGGLAYFNSVTKNGADLSGIGDLTKTAEYVSRFTNMTNEQIVNSIYQSLFGRTGDKDGVDFFLAKLASGQLNINNIAIAIFDGAQGDDLSTVKAKVAAADLFTSHLDLQSEIDAYKGNNAAQIGRDFITAVNKDNPGTVEKVDSAIVKTVQNQGQAPGDDTGAGGGGGGGTTTPTTFEIHQSVATPDARAAASDGISFGGNATGKITLGQTGGMDMSTSKMAAPVELPTVTPIFDLTPKVSLLTGERGGAVATFPDGSVAVYKGVTIANKALPADLVLKDNLNVFMDAETASTHEISGKGTAYISGSAGEQEIHVTASGNNSITGGLDADIIDIKGASGYDNIYVNGVSDSEAQDAINAASAARDAVAARDTLKAQVDEALDEAAAAASELEKASQTVADAEKDVKTAQVAVNVADAADKVAIALVKAVGDLDSAINLVFKFGINQITLKSLRSLVENSKIIPQDLKETVLSAIPANAKDFKVDAFLDKVHSYVDAYKQQADSALASAESKLDDAKDHLSTAQDAESTAKENSDDANSTATDLQTKLQDASDPAKGGKSDTDLALDKQNAESAVDGLKDKIHTDSMIGHEDKVVGFEQGHDSLNLPGHKIVGDIEKAGFTFGDHDYNVSVSNGIAHITESNGDTSSPIALSGKLLDAALSYLSDDSIVKQGETVAFDYADGNETGLYVFQGGDYGSDVGVKLIGLHTDQSIDLATIMGARL